MVVQVQSSESSNLVSVLKSTDESNWPEKQRISLKSLSELSSSDKELSAIKGALISK